MVESQVEELGKSKTLNAIHSVLDLVCSILSLIKESYLEQSQRVIKALQRRTIVMLKTPSCKETAPNIALEVAS